MLLQTSAGVVSARVVVGGEDSNGEPVADRLPKGGRVAAGQFSPRGEVNENGQETSDTKNGACQGV